MHTDATRSPTRAVSSRGFIFGPREWAGRAGSRTRAAGMAESDVTPVSEGVKESFATFASAGAQASSAFALMAEAVEARQSKEARDGFVPLDASFYGDDTSFAGNHDAGDANPFGGVDAGGSVFGASAGDSFSAFGSSAFGSNAFGGSAFESSAFGGSAQAADEGAPPAAAPAKRPREESSPVLAGDEVRSGEEGEEIRIEVRAKLFVWTNGSDELSTEQVPVFGEREGEPDAKRSKTQEPAADAALSTTGELVPSVDHATACAQPSDASKLRGEWVDFGVGPLRLNQDLATGRLRILMRQESFPGGPGTRVLVNTGVSGDMDWRLDVDCKAIHCALLVMGRSCSRMCMLRFRSSDDATRFYAAVDRARHDSPGE
jgi:hypothetical protein